MGAAIASNSPSDILPNLPELAFFIFVGAATVTIIIVIREIYQWFARGDR
ncbi:MAG: hypothetical protein IPK16_26110 [Anaerolineales bacterium]|nr:hypothetical protein [Anaerolineales bacterium]